MAPTHQQTHDAGRHLAVAEALMRGYPAALVGRSSYIEVNGHKVKVQVATKGGWQIEDVDKYTSATVERVILVDLTDGLREFYVCSGDLLRSEVRKCYDQYLAKGGTRPRNPASNHSVIYPGQVRKWRNGWRRLV